jgi:hypothetical protein
MDPDPESMNPDPKHFVVHRYSTYNRTHLCRTNTELVFVNRLRSQGIDFQPGGPVRQPYLSYMACQAT